MADEKTRKIEAGGWRKQNKRGAQRNNNTTAELFGLATPGKPRCGDAAETSSAKPPETLDPQLEVLHYLLYMGDKSIDQDWDRLSDCKHLGLGGHPTDSVPIGP